MINGRKYDMRLYVLVVSYDPLVIYLYKDGLVRFSTEKYSLKPKNMNKQCVHLTNYSINKKAENYVRNNNKDSDNEDEQATEDQSKWSYNQLKTKLVSLGADWETVDSEIKDVLIKSIISVEPHIVHSMNVQTKHKNVCFELYGFDVILDSKLKPWLLEVNVGPSLSSSSPFDKRLKTKLICDMLTLVGVRPISKGSEKQKIGPGGLPRLRHHAESEKVSSSYSKLHGRTPAKTMLERGVSFKGNDRSKNEEFQVISEFVEQQDRLGSFN